MSGGATRWPGPLWNCRRLEITVRLCGHCQLRYRLWHLSDAVFSFGLSNVLEEDKDTLILGPHTRHIVYFNCNSDRLFFFGTQYTHLLFLLAFVFYFSVPTGRGGARVVLSTGEERHFSSWSSRSVAWYTHDVIHVHGCALWYQYWLRDFELFPRFVVVNN